MNREQLYEKVAPIFHKAHGKPDGEWSPETDWPPYVEKVMGEARAAVDAVLEGFEERQSTWEEGRYPKDSRQGRHSVTVREPGTYLVLRVDSDD